MNYLKSMDLYGNSLEDVSDCFVPNAFHHFMMRYVTLHNVDISLVYSLPAVPELCSDDR